MSLEGEECPSTFSGRSSCEADRLLLHSDALTFGRCSTRDMKQVHADEVEVVGSVANELGLAW